MKSKRHQNPVETREISSLISIVEEKSRYSVVLRSHNNLTMSELTKQGLINLVAQSRNNFLKEILLDSKIELNSLISAKDIVSTLALKPESLLSIVGDPQFSQNASAYIKAAYRNHEAFATAIIQTFREDPSYSVLFARLVFPSICSYFLCDEQQYFAYQFLNFLIMLGEVEFAIPYLLSFYNSSILFLETFWDMFSKITAMNRNKPSLFELLNTITKALGFALPYFSPYQISISLDLINTNPERFLSVFFLDFLFSSFVSYTSNHPLINSSKVSKDQIHEVLLYISKSINNEFYDNLCSVFFSNASSKAAPPSFIEYTHNGVIPCILSPIEATLLFKVFKNMTTVVKKPYDLSRVPNSQKTKLFLPGIIEIFLPSNKPSVNHFVIFSDNKMDVPSVPKEYERELKSIMAECESSGVQFVSLIKNINKVVTTDSPKAQKLKNIIKKHLTKDFLKYSLICTFNEFIIKEQLFELFMIRQHQRNEINNMILRVSSFGEILSFSIVRSIPVLPNLGNNDYFGGIKALEKCSVDEDLNKLIPIISNSQNVTQSLEFPDNQEFSLFIQKHKKRVLSLIKYFNRMEEIGIGDRLFLIHHLLKAITASSPKTEWIFPMFVFLLTNSNSKVLIHTYATIKRHAYHKSNDISQISAEIWESWKFICLNIDKAIKSKDRFIGDLNTALEAFIV